MQLCFAKMAKWIEVPFGLKILGDPRNIVLDRGLDPLWRGEGSEENCAE